MTVDLIPAEPVLRLWAVICLGLIGGILAAALLLSCALDHLARRRSTAYPPAIPALVPLSPGSVRGMGRFAIGHQEAPRSLNGPDLDRGSVRSAEGFQAENRKQRSENRNV